MKKFLSDSRNIEWKRYRKKILRKEKDEIVFL